MTGCKFRLTANPLPDGKWLLAHQRILDALDTVDPKLRIRMMRCLLTERLRLGWLVRMLQPLRKTTKARKKRLLQRIEVTQKSPSHVIKIVEQLQLTFVTGMAFARVGVGHVTMDCPGYLLHAPSSPSLALFV